MGFNSNLLIKHRLPSNCLLCQACTLQASRKWCIVSIHTLQAGHSRVSAFPLAMCAVTPMHTCPFHPRTHLPGTCGCSTCHSHLALMSGHALLCPFPSATTGHLDGKLREHLVCLNGLCGSGPPSF